MASGSVNKVIILGNLGKDPEYRTFNNGGSVASFTIATNESYIDKRTNEKKIATEWHNVVVYGKPADLAKDYLKKGQQVYIEGKVRTRKWQDKAGVDRYSTEVVVDFSGLLHFLSSSDDNGNSRSEISDAENNKFRSRSSNSTDTDNKGIASQSFSPDFDDIPF